MWENLTFAVLHHDYQLVLLPVVLVQLDDVWVMKAAVDVDLLMGLMQLLGC